MNADEVREHLLAAQHVAERGYGARGCTVNLHLLDEHVRGSGCWQLYISCGPNVLNEGPGPFFLWAQLSEEVVIDEHPYLDDTTETQVRGQLRCTGSFPETVAALATWLCLEGWRADRRRFVSQNPVTIEYLAVGNAVHVLERVVKLENSDLIES